MKTFLNKLPGQINLVYEAIEEFDQGQLDRYFWKILHNKRARLTVMFDAKKAGLLMTGTHFAAVVANHLQSDSFLLLDCHLGPVWLPWESLWDAMQGLGFISVFHIE